MTLHDDIRAGVQADPYLLSLLNSPKLPYSASESKLLLHENRIYVPDVRDLRLKERHDHPVSGHFGHVKTLDLVRRDYFWPAMRKFVMDFCSSCADCSRAKSSRHKPYGLLKPLPIPERPWTSISMDLIEQLPQSDDFTAILVVVDRPTKMSVFVPTTNQLTAPQLAKLFVQHVFSKHGVPADVVSDRGSEFTSNFWKSLGTLLNMKLNFSTAFHPQSDRQMEWTNQTLEQYLRIYCNYKQDNWHDLLPLAEFAYNNSTHSGTRLSPFFANYGYHPSMTATVDRSVPSAEAHDFSKSLSKVHLYLSERLLIAQEQKVQSANRNRMEPPLFQVGDMVWLNAKNLRTTRPTKKLDYRKVGPFRITERISSHAFRLGLSRQYSKIHPVFHVSLLEPTVPNIIPNRTEAPPPPIQLEGDSEPEFEVSSILDSRKVGRAVQYLVEWKGYENDPTENSWEPISNLSNAMNTLRAFHEANPDKPQAPQFSS